MMRRTRFGRFLCSGLELLEKRPVAHPRIIFVFPSIKIVDKHDSNADGKVSPLDALIAIDHLNDTLRRGEGEPPQVTVRPVQSTAASRALQRDSSECRFDEVSAFLEPTKY
jgi:Dockerin type I domain